ncbi:oxidoreductase [Paenibacillus thermotolerans]|uniref:oxidoreductase n=1 Tax=Paenibacillus thermotolerans TaxID=3027807 RepID=UPI0023677F3A|nr:MULTISPECIES: oxidoreductase [unclassified Paenibacillus]
MDITAKKRTAVIAGATGLVGGILLDWLLASEEYEQVIALVRKPLAMEHPKLTPVNLDFNLLGSLSVVRADDVFCCLGTTIKKAKTREAFRTVDYEYPVKLADVAARAGAKRFLVISSMGANPRSLFFYNRVKGDMENKLKEAGLPQLYIFRPSLLLGERSESRPGEELGAKWAKRLLPLMVGPLAKYRPIEATQVAYAMYRTAVSDDSGESRLPAVLESDAIASVR